MAALPDEMDARVSVRLGRALLRSGCRGWWGGRRGNFEGSIGVGRHDRLAVISTIVDIATDVNLNEPAASLQRNGQYIAFMVNDVIQGLSS